MKTNITLSILGATPAMLTAWLADLPEEVLLQKEHPEAWHTTDIIKHLIFGEQTDWIPRLKLMTEAFPNNELPELIPFDMEGHHQIKEQDISRLLKQFADLRKENLIILKSMLQQYDFEELKAGHPEFGMVTGKQHLSSWVAHDQTHIYQIARNLTSLFANDVGPWAAYLRIIRQNQV